jgi:hypothetical protein
MKITAFTVLICVFATISLVRLLRNVARDGLGVRSAGIWALIWFSLAVFSIFPDLLNQLIEAAGMENRLFFLLTIAVLVLSALLFNLTSRVDRMNRDIGLAVRELAILNYKLQKGGSAESSRAGAPSRPGDPPQETVRNDTGLMRQNPLDHSR